MNPEIKKQEDANAARGLAGRQTEAPPVGAPQSDKEALAALKARNDLRGKPGGPPKAHKTNVGQTVNVVTATSETVEAEVTETHSGDGNLVDLKFSYGGEEVVITSSPYDETGKQPDSWH